MDYEEYRRVKKEEGLKNKQEQLQKSDSSEISTLGQKNSRLLSKNSRPFVESEPQNMSIKILQENLSNCLTIIDDEVMKGYVTQLSDLPIVRQEKAVWEDLNDIYFFKLSELVYQEDEFMIDKLAMLFQAFANRPTTLILMLRSDGDITEFYLGVRPNDERTSGTIFKMLKQSLLGFFPGSQISDYLYENMKQDLKKLPNGSVSSVTSVADYKQSSDGVNNKTFIQGLEKFVDAMRGKAYTSIFIADNLSYDELMRKKRDYEQIYTQLSPFANMQYNFSISDSTSDSSGSSEGQTTSRSHTRTQGRTHTDTVTQSHVEGKSETNGQTENVSYTDTQSVADGKSYTKGRSHSATFSSSTSVKVPFVAEASISVGVTKTENVSDSISKTLTHGFSNTAGMSQSKSIGVTSADSTGMSQSDGTSESQAHTTGEALNLMTTKTLTDTFGTSRGLTLNAQDMTLNSVMNKLKLHLERMEECESFGMWNFAAYFVGEKLADTETAANIYKSIVGGAKSGIERSAINSWQGEAQVKELMPYLTNFVHPKFVYKGFSYDRERAIEVNPSALVSTNELAIHMGLPRYSVRGLPVVEHASFAQEVISRKSISGKRLHIGKVHHMGQTTNTDVVLDLNSLSMHTFITGSTGSGKSNVAYHILGELIHQKVPFLVIEPAKGEYKKVFTDVRCYGTNPLIGEMLKINPFSFPEGIHVLEHIDRIVEIFNVCWPMYAAMPAVLKESIENAYKSAGWDLDLSVNEKVEHLYPTFDDVLRELDKTINNSEYSADTKGDYIGSLSTRIKSLTNGINGRIFVSDEMDLSMLFDQNAIVDISRVGASETKALIMGLIVMKLQEYRMATADEMNAALKHVTVLEEAHHLLKKTSTEQSADSSNLVGKSVEMLTNTIAEIRTFGEGFIIVDQAPNLLDTTAIRNTNTKIVLRLPESTDRDITGGAMALHDAQFAELSKLPTGVAAVYQNDWQDAVLCQLPEHQVISYQSQIADSDVAAINKKKKKMKQANDALLQQLINSDSHMDLDTIKDLIMKSNVAAKVRKDLIMNLETRNTVFEWAIADFIKKNYDLSDVFRGTRQENWKTLSELSTIMIENLRSEFSNFSDMEMLKILYYVCRIEHERYPTHHLIEQLRVEYLREQVF